MQTIIHHVPAVRPSGQPVAVQNHSRRFCIPPILGLHPSGQPAAVQNRSQRFCRLLLLSTLFFTATVWAQGLTYQVGVDGLACPFCAYGIEKQLQKLDGVKQVAVDIEKGQVLVTMADGKALDRSQVEQAVKKAGFSLRSFEPSEGEDIP